MPQEADKTVTADESSTPSTRPRACEHAQRQWLMVIAVLLAVAVVGLWTRELPASASAEDPVVRTEPGLRVLEGSTAQRAAILTELVKINQKIDRLQATMTAGQVKVIVVQDDKKAEEVRHAPATQPQSQP